MKNIIYILFLILTTSLTSCSSDDSTSTVEQIVETRSGLTPSSTREQIQSFIDSGNSTNKLMQLINENKLANSQYYGLQYGGGKIFNITVDSIYIVGPKTSTQNGVHYPQPNSQYLPSGWRLPTEAYTNDIDLNPVLTNEFTLMHVNLFRFNHADYGLDIDSNEIQYWTSTNATNNQKTVVVFKKVGNNIDIKTEESVAGNSSYNHVRPVRTEAIIWQ